MTVTAAKFNTPFDALLDRTAALAAMRPITTTFTANGSIEIPANALLVRLFGIGSGGAGAAGTTNKGGGGGSSGGIFDMIVPPDLYGFTYNVVVGNPGASYVYISAPTSPIATGQQGVNGVAGSGTQAGGGRTSFAGAGGAAGVSGESVFWMAGGGGGGNAAAGGDGGRGYSAAGGLGGLSGTNISVNANGGVGYGAGGGGGGDGTGGGGGGAGGIGQGGVGGVGNGTSNGGSGVAGVVYVTVWLGLPT